VGDLQAVPEEIADVEVDYGDNVDVGIEFDIIEQMHTSARVWYRAAEYAKAEEYFRRVLQCSDEKYGKRYRWRAECIEYIAMCCSKLRKWDDAEQLFLELLDPISPKEKQYNLTHGLAEVYLGKKDYERAELLCKQAIEGRRLASGLGKEHVSYHQSVDLLANIYEAKGDPLVASVCREMLPPSQLNIQRAELERLSHMKVEEAADEIEYGCLKELLPAETRNKAAKWAEIKNNIIESGQLGGSGVGLALLHVAAKYGDAVGVKFLLEKGANVNAVDSKGNTALHMAAKGRGARREEVVQILLNYHADANMRRRDDERTALIIAVQKRQVESIRLLAAASTHIDVKDGLGYTAIHYAAASGDESAMWILLAKGANVDCVGHYGRTPLHSAATAADRNAGVIRMLLQHGVNAKAKDRGGNTAYSLASKNSQSSDVVELLQKGNQRKDSWFSGTTLGSR
jgi:Ankyrin repeats (3 copies)/Ankyrin repeats (many copies)/Ankyrin repeat